MADDLGNVRKRRLNTMVGVESNRTIPVPLEEIIVDQKRRPINEMKVGELMQSIDVVGLLQPIMATGRTKEDGSKEYRLVGGGHRLEVYRRRGWPTIPCTILKLDQDLRIELAEIDQNFIRNDPSPAVHALLTGRRKEIILALAAQDGALSQDATAVATAPNEAESKAREKTGRVVGSVRDQSDKTGDSKDIIHRSTLRFEKLGPAILKNLVGTSLDTGVELNALMKLPHAEREDLARAAAAGKEVTARKARRKAEREEKHEPQHEVSVIDIEHAMDEFWCWFHKYKSAWEKAGVWKQIEGIGEILIEVYGSIVEPGSPGSTR